MDKLGVGIIGTGWVSGEHIKAFARNPRAEVVAVCSRDAARAEAHARAFGLEDCRAYDSLDEMLKDERVRVVSICTPHRPARRAGDEVRRGGPPPPHREADRDHARESARARAGGRGLARQDGGQLRAPLEPALRDDQGAARGRDNRKDLLRRGRLPAWDRPLVPAVRVEHQEGHGGEQPAHGGVPRGRRAALVPRAGGGRGQRLRQLQPRQSAALRVRAEQRDDPQVRRRDDRQGGLLGRVRHALRFQDRAARRPGDDPQQPGLHASAGRGRPTGRRSRRSCPTAATSRTTRSSARSTTWSSASSTTPSRTSAWPTRSRPRRSVSPRKSPPARGGRSGCRFEPVGKFIARGRPARRNRPRQESS